MGVLPLLMRRVASLALSVVFSVGGVGLCAGWEATPEARMACCASGNICPMRNSAPGADASDPRHVVSQAEADNCCASSERDDSTPPSLAFIPVVALAHVVSPVASVVDPAATPFDAWRAFVPLPGSHVPKHVLLSVFLI